MSSEIGSRIRHGAAFWRAHHEAWQQSELNQREYCEAQGIPLKAFGNWRTRFVRGFALSRLAGTQPADPAPTMMQSNVATVMAEVLT